MTPDRMRFDDELAAPSPGRLVYPERVEEKTHRLVDFRPVAVVARRLVS
jgi:hypothetical protein